MNDELGEWIEHDGQRVPDDLEPDDMVEVHYRDGEFEKDVVKAFEWPHHRGVTDNSADILEYRLVIPSGKKP